MSLSSFKEHLLPNAFFCFLAGVLVLSFSWSHPEVDITHTPLPLISALPFGCLLLSLALLPVLLPKLWHAHFGKMAFFWVALLLIPLNFWGGGAATLHLLADTTLLEYLPFILLISALFTTTGGIHIQSRFAGTPLNNTLFLGFGTLLASWIGTTGAAMLLIRPFIMANGWRTHKAHLKIFLIFLVANIGGVLTPLGDPPLFLGLLNGVDFFWPTSHLFLPFLCVSGPLLLLFWVIDTWLYRQAEDYAAHPPKDGVRFYMTGGLNLLLLGGVLATVLWGVRVGDTLTLLFHLPASISVWGVVWPMAHIFQNGFLLMISLVSWGVTPVQTRESNAFSWAPLLEVAKIFLAIFITAIPVLIALKAGLEGPFADLVRLVGTGPEAHNTLYFWLCGGLSAFLDNAPTYLVFFNMAGGNAAYLMTEGATTLTAISLGAVFMGAMTYIGNAPNFMIKAIAEQQGIRMPNFLGFLGWSFCCLVPLFILVNWVFLS